MSAAAPKTLATITAPTPVVESAPAVAERKQNSKEKAAIDKGLAEVRIETVRVDGLVRLVRLLRFVWWEGGRGLGHGGRREERRGRNG